MSVYLYIVCVAAASVAAFLEPPAEKVRRSRLKHCMSGARVLQRWSMNLSDLQVPFNSSLVSMGIIIVGAFTIALAFKTGITFFFYQMLQFLFWVCT